ncbi:hypothetical protein H4R20_001980 [Coemansia guatemalensis]|uniref:J domain-containing protein n=1 Tax=Coemansia guatemalensis TaxID=2761395 RepID=A0A9W8I3C7_9FUNG|nr:hypothetical protein H4R20_001980 [Coemansia guatemalensis]
MRLVVVVVALILVQLCSAWEKLDHEIFELYDDIKRHEPTSDWYELLSVSPKSTVEEINRSYRQLSKKYHPDKLRRLGSERSAAEEKRFQRIGLVVNILRNKESRKRYNFFRKNGVPVWRGTGYLYRRWRPGFISVVVGLLVFASAMQYLFHHLSYWRAQQRIRDIELQQDKLGGKLRVRREDENRQSARRMRRRQKANGGVGTLPNNSEDDSGFEGEENDQFQVNTVGVINPYAVRPAAFGRLLIVRLPVVLATTALSLVGLRSSNTKVPDGDEQAAEEPEDTVSEEAHHDAVAAAIQNIDSPAIATANSEAKAKKASKKAAKADARRRRTPIADDNDRTNSVKRLFDPVTGKLTTVSDSRRTESPSNASPRRGGARGRGKSKGRKSADKNATPVVPRILVRPDRAAAEPEIEQPPRPGVESVRRTPKPRTTAFHSTQESLSWSPSAAIRLAAVSPTGKLLGTSVRRALGEMQIRSSIGILGRAAVGKSLLLSQLAQSSWTAKHAAVFPSNGGRTLGIDVYPTLAGTMLVDAPPVLTHRAVDKWTHRDTDISKAELARVHNLQITLLLLQVCDTLLVVVDAARLLRGRHPADMTPEDWVDAALARLLLAASALAKSIPGFSQPAALQKSGGCRIHVVLSLTASNLCIPAHAIDRDAVGRAYESATGISVANVSVLPRYQPAVTSDELRFLSIAESWSSTMSLYSTIQQTGKRCRSLLPPRLLASRKKNTDDLTFEESVAEIRNLLLGTVPTGRWWVEGTWAATFLRAWDSIRRSDLLHESAVVPDSLLNAMDTLTTHIC